MKKARIIVPTVFLIIVIGLLTVYSIYGSTLVDITSEESISKHIAIDPQKPITILKTEKAENYFGILYKDSLNEEYDYSFRYITKSPFYKNRYDNVGGTSNSLGDETLGFTSIKSPDENENQTDVFVYYLGNNKYKYNKCSIFTYSVDAYSINYEEISKEEEIIEKVKGMADSVKKIDEIELPDDNIFIITKTYDLDYSYDIMVAYDGEVSEKEMKQKMIDMTDSYIAEYREYLKGINNE